jgi:NIMA (never in mitosis gene a)-related kinase
MSLNDFEILKDLGTGAFGSVFQVKRKSDELIYALKRVKVGKMNERDKQNSLNEVRVLASMCHPNVIDYKEAFYDEESESLNIVMEYADEGDLAAKIKSNKSSKTLLSENEIWSIFIQIVSGLKSLHEKKIMHRDMKCANIFIKKGEVKLGDLNVSKVVKSKFLQTQTGTPYYASPEVWSEKPYDYKSDMWSLGCVLYEMCSLKPPFRANSLETLYKTIMKGIYEQVPIFYSKDLQSIINSLLSIDPKKRPSCDQLLSNITIKKKIESEKLNMISCQGTLLKTMKWPANFTEINDKLSKLKRYEINKESISDQTSSKLLTSKSHDFYSDLKSKIDITNKIMNPENIAPPTILKKCMDLAGKENVNNLSNINNENAENKSVIKTNYRPLTVKPVTSNHSVTPRNKNKKILKRIKFYEPYVKASNQISSIAPSSNISIDLYSLNQIHESKKTNVNQSKIMSSNNNIVNHYDKCKPAISGDKLFNNNNNINPAQQINNLYSIKKNPTKSPIK